MEHERFLKMDKSKSLTAVTVKNTQSILLMVLFYQNNLNCKTKFQSFIRYKFQLGKIVFLLWNHL